MMYGTTHTPNTNNLLEWVSIYELTIFFMLSGLFSIIFFSPIVVGYGNTLFIIISVLLYGFVKLLTSSIAILKS